MSLRNTAAKFMVWKIASSRRQSRRQTLADMTSGNVDRTRFSSVHLNLGTIKMSKFCCSKANLVSSLVSATYVSKGLLTDNLYLYQSFCKCNPDSISRSYFQDSSPTDPRSSVAYWWLRRRRHLQGGNCWHCKKILDCCHCHWHCHRCPSSPIQQPVQAQHLFTE